MWNHRLVNVSDEPTTDPVIRVCEVYYNEAGQPCGYCDATVQGETFKEALENYKQFACAFEKSVLTGKTDFNHSFISTGLEN